MRAKEFRNLLVVAILAVGLSLGIHYATAAFTTMGPPVTNNYTQALFQELRGFKMVYAVAGTAEDGATTTVTGMEAGDVIIDIVNLGADASTISSVNLANIDESGYTAASGGAVLDTSIAEPTAGDNLIFFFVDVDNTN